MTKPVVVLLHGVGLDHTVWEAARAHLSPRFEVVAPDLPGHGAREPVDPGVTLADLASDVAAAIPTGAHVVGFSLGALVAQHLAIHRPEIVATLTSVSSVCRRTEAERQAVEGRLRAAEDDFEHSAARSIERWYAGTDVDRESVRHTEEVLLANDRSSFLAAYRVFASADAELAPHLAEVRAPSLAITGELDPGSTPEMSYRLAADIPDCATVIVEGARHMLPVERPRELADHVHSFIGRYADV